AHETVRNLYHKRLEHDGVLTRDDVDKMKAELRQKLDAALEIARENRPRQGAGSLGGLWKGMSRAGADWSAKTNISPEVVKTVAEGITRVPADFTVHPKLR